MRELRKFVELHQGTLREHRIFDALDDCRSVASVANMARALAWWPMVFQDMLRMTVTEIRGAEYERFVEYHKHEDAGHDRWFVEDLRVLGVREPILSELFSEDFLPLREACYALAADVRRCEIDAQRAALLMALEQSGRVFFESVSAAVARVCPQASLRYFARKHLDTDTDYDLFRELVDSELNRIDLSPAQREQAQETATRTYAIVEQVFSCLAGHLEEGVRSVSDVRSLQGRHTLDAVMRRAGA